MAKYDHGGGCPCGLYKECPTDCEHHPDFVKTHDVKYDWVPVGYTAKLDCVGGEISQIKFEQIIADPGWAYYVPDDSVADGQYSWDFTKPRVRVKAGSQRVD